MSRPVQIRDDVILDAARRIFLKHGYGAGTRQVARAAGVSEGSLFKRFKNKDALFLSAMALETGRWPWQDRLMQSVGTGDLSRTLGAAGLQILREVQSTLPRFLMVRSSGLDYARSPCADRCRMPHPVQKIRALAEYFRAERKTGRLVMNDPDVHAQAFIGMLSQYVIHELLFGYRSTSPRAYVRNVVDMLLRATATAAARPRTRRTARRIPRPRPNTRTPRA